MKYLCLVYANEKQLHSLPESPEDAECHAYSEQKNPHAEFLAGEALESVETATTVRPRDNDVTITDGPFAETKEQLVGFYMIEARDLNHAIDYAKGIPAARVGSIEVRPVRNLDI
ncbi:MAG TPA: dehydrogenase [Idiomarina abyssalis]|jgi:hypothetical protein|uniref:YciI family protein n=1 Tax=Idiomarina TaxID=135575 RepID=UPI000C3E2CF1|nr:MULTISPECIES: YciI family protein [Idiomarina]MAB20936.1 dehydrogenase [Idiomarina sp.]MBE92221.1 dehydrogenase [Idiomarina sp.]MBH94701.1 dehydrogenase [Idiomarina sp.]HAS14330.1 dehydrogenase [Idiomarina abyssalis]|tara:strand:+ start:707 stop:1051 length:345 start_codon:yes stop_codon:yes gene_type:complete